MHIKLTRLCRRFQKTLAVSDVDAQLGPGVHGLLGPNGAGKTTLMRMMADILAPSGGDVLLDGQSIRSLGEDYRARLGYLPQQFGYYPGFTAEDFLLYLGAVKGLPRPLAKAQAAELLERVRLLDHRKKKIQTFSGGMKQRLGIAQALLGSPDILLLDEPTAGLDPKERIYFRNMIAEYAKERIVLLSTHIVSDVESIADNVLVMGKGRLLHQGAPAKITAAVEGRVWECLLPSGEAEALMLRYPVTNFRNEGESIRLRLVSGAIPCEAARPVSPTLEDLYLYYFSEEESHGAAAV